MDKNLSYVSHGNLSGLEGLFFTIYKVPSQDTLEQEACIHVQQLPDSEKCSFVKQAPDCLTESSFVPYLQLLFCEFDTSSRYLGVLTCVVWLVLMFFLLGKSANDFFCPALTVIARVLGLSENLAGVTVLAFGNGSPDIFTSLVGAPRGRSQLVFGELIGSGLFVTSVIAGSICTLRPFKPMERPFLRDVIFYLGAAYWTFYIFYKGVVTTMEAIGFIILYVVYIAVVLAERVFSKPALPAAVIAETEWRLTPSNVTETTISGNVIGNNPADINESRSEAEGLNSSESEEGAKEGSNESPRSSNGSPIGSGNRSVSVSDSTDDTGVSGSGFLGNSMQNSSHSLPESLNVTAHDSDVEEQSQSTTPGPRRTRSHTVSTVQELAIHYERLQQLYASGLVEELRRERQLEEQALGSLDPSLDEETPLLGRPPSRHHHHAPSGFWRELRAGLSISTPDQEDTSKCNRFLAFLQLPVVLALKLLVPVVNYTAPRHGWCRPLNSLHCITCPLFCVLATQVSGVEVAPWLPLWLLTVLLGTILALFVLFTTRHDRPPKYHNAFAFLGFSGSVVTIYMVANEVVNLLRAIGILSRMSDTMLGMTVLAWGNSIGDFITNFSIARQGFERMGFSACYGGPLFNILLGIGISFTMATVESGEHKILIQYGEVGPLLAFFLALSLVSTLIAFPLMNFTARRSYGFYLLGLYFMFLLSATLLETGLLPDALTPSPKPLLPILRTVKG